MIERLPVTGVRSLTQKQSDWVYKELLNVLARAQKKLGKIVAVSGMALGTDLLYAEASLELGIPFEAFIPYKYQTGWGQRDNGEWIPLVKQVAWSEKDLERYLSLLGKASSVVDCSESYNGIASNALLLRHRNKCMIARGKKFLVSVWTGQRGGTAHATQYALDAERQIYMINPQTGVRGWNKLNTDENNQLIFDSN